MWKPVPLVFAWARQNPLILDRLARFARAGFYKAVFPARAVNWPSAPRTSRLERRRDLGPFADFGCALAILQRLDHGTSAQELIAGAVETLRKHPRESAHPFALRAGDSTHDEAGVTAERLGRTFERELGTPSLEY